jgi:hypothetical protein
MAHKSTNPKNTTMKKYIILWSVKESSPLNENSVRAFSPEEAAEKCLLAFEARGYSFFLRSVVLSLW